MTNSVGGQQLEGPRSAKSALQIDHSRSRDMLRDLQSRSEPVDWQRRPWRRRRGRSAWPAVESVVERALIIICLLSASISCQFEPNGQQQQEEFETRQSDNDHPQSRLASSRSISANYFEPDDQQAVHLGASGGAPPVVYSDTQQQFIANLIRLHYQQQQQQQLQEQLESQLAREKNLASQLASLNSLAKFNPAAQSADPMEAPRRNRSTAQASSYRLPARTEKPSGWQLSPKLSPIRTQLSGHEPTQERQRITGVPHQVARPLTRARGSNLLASQPGAAITLDGEFGRLVSGQPIASRPKAIDLAGLIGPGQTLLTSKTTNRLRPDQPQPARESTSVLMGANQIETILKDLSPLALDEQDKATGLMSVASLPNDSPDALRALALDEQHEQIEAAKDEEDSEDRERLLPNTQLFAESKEATRQNGAQKQAAVNNEDEDQTRFLNALKTLSSQLAVSDVASRPNYLSLASTRDEDFFRRDRQPRPAHTTKSVPIELLVDHLMAGSRLATRRGDPTTAFETGDHSDGAADQHAEPQHLYGGGDDDDEEEEDEDGGGGEDEEEQEEIPGDVGESDALSGSESSRNETRVEPPSDPINRRVHSSLMVAQNDANATSENWKPLQGTATGSPALRITNSTLAGDSSAAEMKQQDGRGDLKRGKTLAGRARNRRARGRRRRRRRARGQQESTILIGKKRLTRLELIRLIKVLNKLANDKRESEQRETSRKLLRHLIKVAIENYKQSQARLPVPEEAQPRRPKPSARRQNQSSRGPKLDVDVAGDLTDKRLRDSLRSLLLEPTLGASNSSSTDSSPKVSVLMQPWRERSVLIQAQRLDGDEDLREPPSSLDDEQQSAEKELKRPKTLVDLSEDLERYFDTDFFEDLADKERGNATTRVKTERTRARPGNSQTATTNLVQVGGRPVVLDSRRADEADEEDVDLDHVRLLPSESPRKPGEQSGRRQLTRDVDDDESDEHEQVAKSPRRRRQRPRRGPATKPNASESRPAKSAENSKPTGRREERDRIDEETDPEADEEDDNDKPRPRRRRPEEGLKARPRARSQQRRKASPSRAKADGVKGEKQAEEGEQEEEEEPDDEEGDQTRAADDERREAAAANVEKSGSRSTRKRSKATGGKSQNRARRRQPQKNRDEIPAPIVSSRAPRAGASKVMAELESELDSDQPVQRDAKKSTKSKGNKSKLGAKPSGSREPAPKAERRGKKTREKPKVAVNKSKKAESKEPVSKEVVNYFNEGTEICEDGKCKLAVKSSHPKVVERLKSDKSPGKQDDLIGKVDKWLQTD